MGYLLYLMFRCDRRCDGCDGKFENLEGTKHTLSLLPSSLCCTTAVAQQQKLLADQSVRISLKTSSSNFMADWMKGPLVLFFLIKFGLYHSTHKEVGSTIDAWVFS